MRYLSRVCVAICSLLLVPGCDETTKTGTDLPAAGSARPTIDLVVRTVELKKNMATRPVDGKGADDEWTAVDGKVYAVVTVDMAHNSCKAGDKIEISKASLATASGKVPTVGGGPTPAKLCVQCQSSEPLNCNNASRLRPYTFIFEVDEKGDVSKAKLNYRDREVPLSVAKFSDSRGNDEISKQIAGKKDELSRLKKKLENTSNLANGKVIQGEMERVTKEIAALEKKKK